MKKLLLILLTISLMSGTLSFAQDVSPLPSVTVKKLIAPNTPVFYYNTVDSAFWVFKGETGWLRLATNEQLKKYYVPYIGASKTVDLGNQLITSKKQLLPLFNGACTIPTILDNGNGTITVGDGEYHLSTRTDGKGTQSYVITGGIFSLTDNTTNYLVADYNSGTPILKVITDVNLINETTVVPVYTAYRSGTTLHFQNWDALGVALANKVHQSIVKTQRYRRESGLGISEFPTRYLSIGNGKVWVGAVPVTIDAVTTNTDNLRLYYHSGGVWTLSLQTQYNNTQYDNGTDLVTLTANRYAVNWIFRGVESQKHLYVVLGRGDYTLAQAQEAVLPAIPAIISSHAVLIGKLIVQRDATTATSIQSAFDVQFATATPNAHNDLTGRDVSDVHPAGSITFTPTGTYTATTVADALAQIDNNTPDRSILNEIQAPTRVGDLIGLTQTSTTISISGKEDKSNKVTSISGSSTDTQYPSAKLLYDQLALKAPASGSGSYIWNTTTQQPSSNFNISGNGILGGYLGFSGTSINEPINALNYTQIKIQPSSGNKDAVFQFRPSGTATNSVMEFYHSSSVDANRFIFKNQNGVLKIGGDAFSGNIDIIRTNVTTASFISTGIGLGNSSVINTGAREYGRIGGVNSQGHNTVPYIKFEETGVFDTQGVISFWRNNTESGRFSPLGNFGIGYSTGTEITNNKLAVNGGGYFNGTINSTGYLLNGNNLFSSLSTNAIAKWDGTKFVDGTSGGSTNLSYSTTTSTVTVISDTGTDAILPAATQSNAGILNTVDKTKIDNIWNTSVQALSGTTVTMVWTNGINATISLTGTTTLTITDMPDGGEAQIEVTNGSSSYSFNLNGSTGYTTEVVMGNNATINTTISSHTTVVIWRRGSTLYYGFIYNN